MTTSLRINTRVSSFKQEKASRWERNSIRTVFWYGIKKGWKKIQLKSEFWGTSGAAVVWSVAKLPASPIVRSKLSSTVLGEGSCGWLGKCDQNGVLGWASGLDPPCKRERGIKPDDCCSTIYAADDAFDRITISTQSVRSSVFQSTSLRFHFRERANGAFCRLRRGAQGLKLN